VEMTITNDNSTLTKDAYKAAKAPGAMYQLKLEEDGGSPDTFVLTTVPGCQLLRANFRCVYLFQLLMIFCKLKFSSTSSARI